MKLRENEEIMGVLTKFNHTDDQATLTLTFTENIVIPKDLIESKVLHQMQGKRIGILHIDETYWIRMISDKKEVK